MPQMAFCGEKALSPFWWVASQSCACGHHVRLNANHNISVQRDSEISVHHIWEVSRIMQQHLKHKRQFHSTYYSILPTTNSHWENKIHIEYWSGILSEREHL
jgi:hypothetical protein